MRTLSHGDMRYGIHCASECESPIVLDTSVDSNQTNIFGYSFIQRNRSRFYERMLGHVTNCVNTIILGRSKQ